MSKKIPLDIITDVFCRQPVKSILRFRCVSKTCCSLIDSQDFIKLHLNHSITTRSNRRLILKGAHDLYALDFDTLTLGIGVQPHHHPLNIGSGTEVLGSCNGLIALCNSVQELALFNPSTRKLKTLPLPPCLVGFPSAFIFYGFGQDKSNDDYKLVRVLHFKGNDGDDVEVEVYSLKTNSWRRISNLPRFLRDFYDYLYHSLFRKGYGVLAGGALYWVSPKSSTRSVIVAFDLVAEEFYQLPLPDSVNVSYANVHVDVGSLEGCLCVFRFYNLVYVDMWMMKEHAVKESWTKLFSVQEPTPTRSFLFLRPLGYSRNGVKLLLEVRREKLVWFDLETNSLRTVKIDTHGLDFVDTEICMASLVPLSDAGGGCGGGINGMKRRNLEEEEKIHKKKR